MINIYHFIGLSFFILLLSDRVAAGDDAADDENLKKIAKSKEYLKKKNIRGIDFEAIHKFIGKFLIDFDKFDGDKDGVLNSDEAKEYIKAASIPVDVNVMIKKLDVDGDLKISRDEFMRNAVIKAATAIFQPVFEKLDAEDRNANDGRVDETDILKVLTKEGYSKEEIRDVIDNTPGLDEEGWIDFEKFIKTFFNVTKN